METGQEASSAGRVPGPTMEHGAQAAMAEQGAQASMVDLGIRAAMASPRSRPLLLENPTPHPQYFLGGIRGSIWHLRVLWRRGHLGGALEARARGGRSGSGTLGGRFREAGTGGRCRGAGSGAGLQPYPHMPPASPGAHERLWAGLWWPAGLRLATDGGIHSPRTAGWVSCKRRHRSPANGGWVGCVANGGLG